MTWWRRLVAWWNTPVPDEEMDEATIREGYWHI